MEHLEYERSLIEDRREAIIALCLTGLVTALSFRSLFSRSQHNFHGLIDLPLSAPTWVVLAVNLGFYAYLFWVGIMFYRSARGKERILVVGWFAPVVLGPIQYLVSIPGAVTGYLRAICMTVAFVIAVYIFLETSGSDRPPLEKEPSRDM
jgi:hypothetical protein